ncbi:hypothetical protein ACLB2K_046126 [Fragaria x ananassa]
MVTDPSPFNRFSRRRTYNWSRVPKFGWSYLVVVATRLDKVGWFRGDGGGYGVWLRFRRQVVDDGADGADGTDPLCSARLGLS